MLAKGFGGGERLFVDLVSTLVSMGNDVLAICQPETETEHVLKGYSGINVRTVKTFSTRDPFAWRTIASKIRQHDSDIVQSHLSRGTYLAGKACKQLKKPLVVTLHNYIDLKYYKNVTKFIPATKDQVDYLDQKGIPESKIELIPHFSHLEPVKEVLLCVNEPLVYACYGRMVNKKGFHVALSAFKKLTETKIKATLLIGGDGPELENLKGLCKELGLAEQVKFVGWIKHIEKFLKNVDVFVLPSLDEPFGIVVLEAMAMGKPIISTKSQGPREILNKENAYLAEINNVESLFEALLSAAKNPADREKKARQALSDYKEFYAKEVVVPKFLKLYEQIIAGQKDSF